MNIADILLLKFPKIDLINQVVVRDDGNGAYIAKWDINLGAKPTKADLDKWAVELKSKYDLNQIAIKRESEYPTEKELIVALWEKLVENRPESAEALEVKRQAIKIKYPKPAV